MSSKHLKILNIGIDRALLVRREQSEAQTRQILYSQSLPARLVHIVKATYDTPKQRLEITPNLSVIPCPVRHWLGFIPKAIRLGNQLLNKESFDLIQVQDPFISGLVGAILAKRFKLPLLVGVFSDEIDNPVWLAEKRLNRIANIVGKWVLRKAKVVRTDSSAVVDRLSHHQFPNLTYIPFLITHAQQLLIANAAAEEYRLNLLGNFEGPLLLAVCRLEQEKNIPLMLNAFAKAIKHHKGLVLAIAGSGSLLSQLQQEAERLAPARVRWLGWVSNTKMPAYYQAADLMLLSSNRESAARVLFESALAATAVLSTDTAGAREVIEDGITGMIVPVGDEQAFTDALISLCNDKDKLNKMGRQARLVTASKVSSEVVVNQLRAHYEKALA